MTKISITIEDIADRKACVIAIRKLFASLEEHYGEKGADWIWVSYRDLQAPKWLARDKLSGALIDLEYSDQRLIFEYYAMTKPSKEGLAKYLAAKNACLHEKWREWLAAHREWWVQHGDEYRRHEEIIKLARETQQRPPKLSELPDFPQRPTALFGPRGTTNWRTMHQQIKRVFRTYPKACAAVGEASIEIREEARSKVEIFSQWNVEMKIMGEKPLHKIGKGWRGRRGTKSKK